MQIYFLLSYCAIVHVFMVIACIFSSLIRSLRQSFTKRWRFKSGRPLNLSLTTVRFSLAPLQLSSEKSTISMCAASNSFVNCVCFFLVARDPFPLRIERKNHRRIDHESIIVATQMECEMRSKGASDSSFCQMLLKTKIQRLFQQLNQTGMQSIVLTYPLLDLFCHCLHCQGNNFLLLRVVKNLHHFSFSFQTSPVRYNFYL